MKPPKSKSQPGDQNYGEQETARRRDEWLRRSLNSPPRHQKDMVAERKAKSGKRNAAGRKP
jgi:hypothetical protein